MNKVLIYCNTYYQLITAIQLKLTIKKDDYVALLLSDDSSNSERIIKSLQHLEIFDAVYYVVQNRPDGGRIGDSRRRPLEYLRHKVRLVTGYPFGDVDPNIVFDEIVTYNFHSVLLSLFYFMSKQNPGIVCNLMEEGIFSYDYPIYLPPKDISYKLRKLQSIIEPMDVLHSFYCYNPSFYNGRLAPITIPKISRDDNRIMCVLAELFPLQHSAYNEKYIYFPCVLDKEGGEPIGELDLAIKIAKLVGIDNLLVKVHPRDSAERYKNAGLHVDSNSSVPWEVIQLYNDFDDKVFLSTMSGTLFSANAISDSPVRSFYLYEMCKLEGNNMAKQIKASIEKTILKCNPKYISIAYNMEEIIQ